MEIYKPVFDPKNRPISFFHGLDSTLFNSISGTWPGPTSRLAVVSGTLSSQKNLATLKAHQTVTTATITSIAMLKGA